MTKKQLKMLLIEQAAFSDILTALGLSAAFMAGRGIGCFFENLRAYVEMD